MLDAKQFDQRAAETRRFAGARPRTRKENNERRASFFFRELAIVKTQRASEWRRQIEYNKPAERNSRRRRSARARIARHKNLRPRR